MPPIFSLFIFLWGLSHSGVNGQGAGGDLPIGLFPLSALGLPCLRSGDGGQQRQCLAVVSGLWSPEEQLSSINHRELLAIFYALQHFLPLVQNSAVAVYADNTTALAYLRNQGGTRSAVLNRTAQDLLRWAERHSISLLPQFIMGRNVLADSLSRPNQILGSEWTLKLSVFQQLQRRWPCQSTCSQPH